LRRRAIELVERERTKAGLPVPKAFDESVQNAYNRHADGYSAFVKNQKLGEPPLFFSPEGKGRGTWAVNIDAAKVWLETNIPPLPDLL
jgi:hypothetical protein